MSCQIPFRALTWKVTRPASRGGGSAPSLELPRRTAGDSVGRVLRYGFDERFAKQVASCTER